MEEIMDQEFETICEDESVDEISDILIKYLNLLKENKEDQVRAELTRMGPCEIWIKSGNRIKMRMMDDSSGTEDEDMDDQDMDVEPAPATRSAGMNPSPRRRQRRPPATRRLPPRRPQQGATASKGAAATKPVVKKPAAAMGYKQSTETQLQNGAAKARAVALLRTKRIKTKVVKGAFGTVLHRIRTTVKFRRSRTPSSQGCRCQPAGHRQQVLYHLSLQETASTAAMRPPCSVRIPLFLYHICAFMLEL